MLTVVDIVIETGHDATAKVLVPLSCKKNLYCVASLWTMSIVYRELVTEMFNISRIEPSRPESISKECRAIRIDAVSPLLVAYSLNF
jgi:hypothetical protein